MIELVSNQIYDKITKLINDSRKKIGYKKSANIVESIRDYNNFNPDDNGNDLLGRIEHEERKLSEVQKPNYIMLVKRKVKKDMIELVANQIYDKITKLINDSRKKIGYKKVLT